MSATASSSTCAPMHRSTHLGHLVTSLPRYLAAVCALVARASVHSADDRPAMESRSERSHSSRAVGIGKHRSQLQSVRQLTEDIGVPPRPIGIAEEAVDVGEGVEEIRVRRQYVIGRGVSAGSISSTPRFHHPAALHNTIKLAGSNHSGKVHGKMQRFGCRYRQSYRLGDAQSGEFGKQRHRSGTRALKLITQSVSASVVTLLGNVLACAKMLVIATTRLSGKMCTIW